MHLFLLGSEFSASLNTVIDKRFIKRVRFRIPHAAQDGGIVVSPSFLTLF